MMKKSRRRWRRRLRFLSLLLSTTLLATALKRAPNAIRVDIQDHVTALQDEVRRLVEARQILEAGRDALDPDPVALSRLEQRLARQGNYITNAHEIGDLDEQDRQPTRECYTTRRCR